jgi:glycosyltransferase involved in cell wall biosynthesis/phospholipid N-methyltransferase
MKLSILVPVYNERAVVERSLAQVLAAPLPEDMDRELIIVDDCSTDGTSAILDRIAAAEPRIRLFRQEVNQGKGAAVRFAIQQATGDFCIVQDADLEYDPAEYPRLLRPLLDGHADAVFGSRYLAGEQTRVLPFWHSMINKSLTLVSNMFCNLNVTDMETGYKVFRTDLLKSIPIRSNRFGFEPEITMKSGKRQFRIYEVPISYHGRTYEEGKKIGWKDGLKAFTVIFWYWLIDDLYVEPYARGYINNLSGTPQYVSWMTRMVRQHLGDTVLEIGAGIGNITGRVMGRKLRYVAGEKDALFLHALGNRFLRTPNVEVRRLNAEDPRDYEDLHGSMESVLCLNILEYVDEPEAALRSLRKTLTTGGHMIILVPQGAALYSTVDQTMGHKRRFDRAQLLQTLRQVGLEPVHTYELNKIGKPAWWFYGHVLHSKQISKITLKLFDKTIWLWRRIEVLFPWDGLSLIVVARRID